MVEGFMDDEKIIEKIKKLLELAASPVEAEARLAKKRAEELIAKYSIKLVEESDKPLEILHVPYELKIKNPPTGLREILGHLALAVGQQFGVYVLVSKDRSIRLVGFETNIKLVDYAIDCVVNQGMADFRVGYAKARSMAFAPEFWQGFLLGVHEKFKSDNSQEQGLVVYDPVKDHMKQFQTATTTFTKSDLLEGQHAGRQSGSNVQIRKGVQTSFEGRFLA
jgi:hypothetical protein